MRRPLPALILALFASCGTSEPPPETPQVPAEGDALIVQKVLDGTLDADTALAEVARASGWPIHTSRGYLFATRDQGQGPYTVESPTGAFVPTEMKSNAGLAWALVQVASPAGAEYRFHSVQGDASSDPLSRNFAYAAVGTASFVTLSGKHLERWPGVGDAKIPARTVRVLVPGAPPTHTMYAMDGQNLFGPTPFGGWRLQDAAGPTTLVVGIDNTPDRISEYTPVQDVLGGQPTGGKGIDYADFVEKTVRPFIEARYGTTARVGVMGSSLGGLISYVIKRRYSASYEFVASLSGTMGWGSIAPGVHNPTEIEAWSALGSCPAGRFYLDSGGGPGSGCADSDGDGIQDDTPDAADNYCENVQLRDTLAALGCGTRVDYVFSSGAPHQEGSWRGRSPAIFALFEG
ncbi:MAG TPA: alpha/beta hydrolase-fold protein, partial [Myxococcaceae bacterium]|nr:alpha/beta hydrolase-fold protein [Myxococcaceae bacterium]